LPGLALESHGWKLQSVEKLGRLEVGVAFRLGGADGADVDARLGRAVLEVVAIDCDRGGVFRELARDIREDMTDGKVDRRMSGVGDVGLDRGAGAGEDAER